MTDTDLDVTPGWDPLTLDEVAPILARLHTPLSPAAVIAQSSRPTTASAIFSTHDGPRVFVKRYEPGQVPRSQLEAVHAFIAHLTAQSLDTPAVRVFADGTTVGTGVRGRLYEVTDAAEGEDRYRATPSWDPPSTLDDARSLGAACAGLSLAAQGFDRPACAPNPFQSRFGLFSRPITGVALDAWLRPRPRTRGYLRRRGRDLLHDVRFTDRYTEPLAALVSDLPPQWTHGDLHVSNALWRGHHVSSLIDFGLADRTFALYDLAVAIERNAFAWPSISAGVRDAVSRPVAAALLEGYTSVRPLLPAERAALPSLLAVCQAEAALNWIEYFDDDGDGMAAADWSYDIFFLQHVTWFSTPEGEAFSTWLTSLLDHDPRP